MLAKIAIKDIALYTTLMAPQKGLQHTFVHCNWQSRAAQFLMIRCVSLPAVLNSFSVDKNRMSEKIKNILIFVKRD